MKLGPRPLVQEWTYRKDHGRVDSHTDPVEWRGRRISCWVILRERRDRPGGTTLAYLVVRETCDKSDRLSWRKGVSAAGQSRRDESSD